MPPCCSYAASRAIRFEQCFLVACLPLAQSRQSSRDRVFLRPEEVACRFGPSNRVCLSTVRHLLRPAMCPDRLCLHSRELALDGNKSRRTTSTAQRYHTQRNKSTSSCMRDQQTQHQVSVTGNGLVTPETLHWPAEVVGYYSSDLHCMDDSFCHPAVSWASQATLLSCRQPTCLSLLMCQKSFR